MNKIQKLTIAKVPKPRKFWTTREDTLLLRLVNQNGSNWLLISSSFPGRNPSQCAQRWKKTKPEDETKNMKWTQDEDLQLIQLHKQLISDELKSRTGRQVRDRYINHLNPIISKSKWTETEDQLLWELYTQLGTKWSAISKSLVGRPESMIKNRFYSVIRSRYGNIQNPYYIVQQPKLKVQQNTIPEVTLYPVSGFIDHFEDLFQLDEQSEQSESNLHQQSYSPPQLGIFGLLNEKVSQQSQMTEVYYQ